VLPRAGSGLGAQALGAGWESATGVEEVAATARVGFDTFGRWSCSAQAATAANKNMIATRIQEDESRAEEATLASGADQDDLA